MSSFPLLTKDLQMYLQTNFGFFLLVFLQDTYISVFIFISFIKEKNIIISYCRKCRAVHYSLQFIDNSSYIMYVL